MDLAVGFTRGPRSDVHQGRWTSQESLSLMVQKHLLSNRKFPSKLRYPLQRQVKSFRKDRED